jgi:hypothetical protein
MTSRARSRARDPPGSDHSKDYEVSTLIVDPAPALTFYRELRWSYRRGAERQLVRLSLDSTARAYEFHVRDDDGRSSARVERYVYAADAIVRQSEYEAQLLATGFSLDSFEPVQQRS